MVCCRSDVYVSCAFVEFGDDDDDEDDEDEDEEGQNDDDDNASDSNEQERFVGGDFVIVLLRSQYYRTFSIVFF